MRQNPLAQSLRCFTTTTNGAAAFSTTGSDCLNLFSRIGSMRQADEPMIRDLFFKAAMEDVSIAASIMLWSRDCRGGAGERRVFKIMAEEFEAWCAASEDGNALMTRLVDKAVELGRWDDIFNFTKFFPIVVDKITKGIWADDKLLLKWLPREKSAKKDFAFRLMKAIGLTPKQYRQLCTGVVTTETLMCAKKWQDINLSHVPSVASGRYQKAFAQKHPGYAEWKAGLESGATKVNASVSFPHDVWQMVKQHVSEDVVDATWKALPNYIPEGVSVMAIADTSSSMDRHATASLTCMDISISLGLYIAQKNTGPFKNMLLTFNTLPQLVRIDGLTTSRCLRAVQNMSWGGSTNFEATYDLILDHAQKVGAKQEDIPQYLVCLSDMQFNEASKRNVPHFENIRNKFAQAGYIAPKLVFWNLDGAHSNYPAEASTDDVAMVSGFSPAALKSVLSGKQITPEDVMVDTVGVERYSLL